MHACVCSGVMCATNIKPTAVSSERFRGVVSSMKDSFGFVERADAVREIFFHFSEYEPLDGSALQLGDDVEFSIQSRNVRSRRLVLIVS
jgi:cold shock CspA family protein